MHFKVNHFVYASSDFVYGMNISMFISVNLNSDYPQSLCNRKKAEELMVNIYSHLVYLLPV